jgi:hypothetical protein
MSEQAYPRRVIYVVTSQGGDTYSAMTRLSLASLRLSNPGWKVTIACDAQSHAALTKAHDRLLDEADEVVAWDTPPGDAQFRNRFIKTSLRNILSGEFLFLDSDTLIRSPLNEAFVPDADIAAAHNHSADELARQLWPADSKVLTALGWTTCPDHYFNGGVMFYNDTAAARAFATCWHKKWRESCDRLGRSRDQPAFNAALHEIGPRLAVLPHRLNAQFRANPSVARDATVWHYYASANDPPLTEIELLVARLGPHETVDQTQLGQLAALAQPWRRKHWLDDQMIAWVSRQKKLHSWDRLWFQGRRLNSLRERGRKMLGLPKAMPAPSSRL